MRRWSLINHPRWFFFFNGCSILFSSCFLNQCIIHVSFRVWLYSKCHFLPLEQGGDYSVLCTLKRKTPPAEGNQWLQTSPEVCPGIKSSPCCRSGCDKLVEARKVYLNFSFIGLGKDAVWESMSLGAQNDCLTIPAPSPTPTKSRKLYPSG